MAAAAEKEPTYIKARQRFCLAADAGYIVLKNPSTTKCATVDVETTTFGLNSKMIILDPDGSFHMHSPLERIRFIATCDLPLHVWLIEAEPLSHADSEQQ